MGAPLTNTNNISVITIDLDDTLWDNKPALEYAEDRLYTWLKQNTPRLVESFSIADFKTHRKNLADQKPELRHDMTKQRYASLLKLAEEKDYDKKLVKKGLEVFLQARNNVNLYPDVVPVLKQLSTKYELVTVTNGNANINKVGIDKYFSLSVSPSDVGTSKPDPAMFEYITKQMNVMSNMIVHIGDEPKTDILGAQNAGIRNIWLNRKNMKWPTEHPQPDVEISTLYELIPALETLN